MPIRGIAVRTLPTLLICALAIGGCDSPTLPPASLSAAADRESSETTRLNAWLDARYEEQLEFSPIEQTMLGRKTDFISTL